MAVVIRLLGEEDREGGSGWQNDHQVTAAIVWTIEDRTITQVT
jgi:hypothetical protein